MKKLFSNLSPEETNIKFQNNLQENGQLNMLNFLYYYNGAGVAIGDINNDSLPDIYFCANKKGGNKLYINKGNLKFEDITENCRSKRHFRLVYRSYHGRY